MSRHLKQSTLSSGKVTDYKCACGLLAALVFTAPFARAAALPSFDPVASPSEASVATWDGNNTYAVNDIVSYGGSLYINIAPTAPVTTTTPATAGTNLFDKSAISDGSVILTSTGSTVNIGGFQSSGYINLGGASSFITNITMGVFDPYGVAFYDANHSFFAGSELNGNGLFPASIPISVPAGAEYVRFWWIIGNMGTTLDGAIVNAGTTMQTAYSAFGVGGTSAVTSTTPCAAPTDLSHWSVYTPPAIVAPTTPAPGPWAGKKMFVLGDSITWINPAAAGQIATTIGASLSSQGATAPGVDGFPGRTFDGFQNGQGPTGIYLPVSASVIADVDLMLIELGTNQDSAAGLGTPTDAPDLNGSMSAQMRSMLETIMSWKPGMRIVVIGPYQSNRYNLASGTDGLLAPWNQQLPMANTSSLTTLRNINNAMKSVCNLYGIPFVDTYNESGVNFTTSALWLQDGLHPNSTGFAKFYVPYISAQLQRFVQ